MSPLSARGRPSGMIGFTLVWLGQLVSLLGSGMTWFALSFWAWQETGQATALTLVMLFSFGPTVLLSPLAGALVDRWDRKLVMVLSDVAAGISTVIVLALFLTGRLEIWHLYATGAFAGAFQAFQWPAYSAAITVMVEKAQYGRANGMLSLAETASGILAPLFAGALLVTIGIGGILMIDVATFLFAVGALALVHVPQPPRSEAGEEGGGSLLKESLYGFRYILARPSLLGLQLVFAIANFAHAFTNGLAIPMILARSGDDAQLLATVISASSVGGVIGGIAMSTWGGPKRRVHGVLISIAAGGLFGGLLMGLAPLGLLWLTVGIAGFFMPILNGSNQAIWQAKVPPDVQGRVFSVRRLIAQISFPVALVFAGPMADYLFEPAMRPGGALEPLFGSLFGNGAGAGLALLCSAAGTVAIVGGLGGYFVPAIRNAEDILPDHTPEETVESPVESPVAVELAELTT